MTEKRDIRRKRKRLKVRFGVGEPKRVAFTEDLSVAGMFIITGQPEPPGTLLLVEVSLSDDLQVRLQARVRWAKKVPPNLVRVASKGGMGINILRFESGQKAYLDFIEELRH